MGTLIPKLELFKNYMDVFYLDCHYNWLQIQLKISLIDSVFSWVAISLKKNWQNLQINFIPDWNLFFSTEMWFIQITNRPKLYFSECFLS